MADYVETSDHSVLWCTLQGLESQVCEVAQCAYGTSPASYIC